MHAPDLTPSLRPYELALQSSLDSEEGRVKLAALLYLSNVLLRNSPDVMLVPMNQEEVAKSTALFMHPVYPASRMCWNSSILIDKVTRKQATILGLDRHPPRIESRTAVIGAGYRPGLHSSCQFLLELRKDEHGWKVVSSKLVGVE